MFSLHIIALISALLSRLHGRLETGKPARLHYDINDTDRVDSVWDEA
jgi:hypothetical protein